MKPQTIILGVAITVLGVAVAAVTICSQSQDFLSGGALRVTEELANRQQRFT